MADSLDDLTPDEKRRLLAKLLRERSRRESDEGPSRFPLSAGQQALWYAFRRNPALTSYNVYLPTRVRSSLDLDAMRSAVETLVERHGALRTRFGETEIGSEPFQEVVESSPPEFRTTDLPGASSAQIAALVQEETQRPFDLTEGPLLRVAAIRLSEDDTVVVATTHHIVVDFWSLVLMMNEIRELYEARISKRPPQLAPPQSNYDRFVQWQNELTGGLRGQQITDYWKRQLKDIPATLQWTTDFKRPQQFSHRAATVGLAIPAGFGGSVKRLAQRLNVTANAVLIAIAQVLIARFSGQDSFSIGTPFSGRSQQRFEHTVGFFVNLLPITADISENPRFEDLVVSVGEKMVAALANEALPFSEIVKQCAPGRDASRHPLFQVSCTIEKSHLASERGRAAFLLGDGQVFDDFGGLRQESLAIERPTCEHDMEFVFEFDGDDLRGMVSFCSDLFSKATVQSLSAQFTAMALGLVGEPEIRVKQVAWDLSDQDDASDTGCSFEETVPEVMRHSSGPLIDAARRIASSLVSDQVSRGELIPVCLPRGPSAMIASLGVMLAGAVPVPIDEDQPCVSLRVLQQDAPIRRLFAVPGSIWLGDFDGELLDVDSMSKASPAPLPDLSPDDLAYVIYTSGTTGVPKGVAIEHRGIARTLRTHQEQIPIDASDRLLLLLSHQFDAAFEIFLFCVSRDAETVWPVRPRESPDLDEIIERIAEKQITILPGVGSLLAALTAHQGLPKCDSLRIVWTGGESVPEGLIEAVRRTIDCPLWNHYGPTEASVQVCLAEITDCDSNRRVPIGRELPGARVAIVDENLAPVPMGVPGQLVIGGPLLARGYLNRPEQTAESFVNSEHLRTGDGRPMRIYLTGDLCRRREDGQIEFLSRIDHQVKVRGFRIELEEIERTIEAHPDVRRAALKVVGVGTSAERLAAFVEAAPELDTEDLRRHLTSRLPHYKRPTTLTLMECLPIGTSGKVQRDRLPDPDEQSDWSARTPPSTDLEVFLEKRFSETLDQPAIGIDANFFEAGGTSLQAAVLSSALAKELDLPIPASLLFDLGNIRSIAGKLARLAPDRIATQFGDASLTHALEQMNGDGDPLLAELQEGGDRPPIFVIHPPGGIVACYRDLAGALPDHQPLVAVRARGLHGEEPLPESIQSMAADYARSIRARFPTGPYWIGGWSLGGVIAYEVARQIDRSGGRVAGIILMDSAIPEEEERNSREAGLEYGIELSLSELGELSEGEQLPYLYRHAERLGVLQEDAPAEVVEKVIEDLRRLFSRHLELCQSYHPDPIDVPLLLLRPKEVPGDADMRSDRGWGSFGSHVDVVKVSGHHHSMVKQPGASEMAEAIAAWMATRSEASPQGR